MRRPIVLQTADGSRMRSAGQSFTDDTDVGRLAGAEKDVGHIKRERTSKTAQHGYRLALELTAGCR